MKFKRDNTKVALTQEMKDAAIQEQQEKQENAKRIARRKRKDVEKRRIAERKYEQAVQPAIARKRSYPPIEDQLDKLWHDMDSGYIKVNKRNANTWYHGIKKIKEHTPLANSWKSDLEDAYKEIVRLNKELAAAKVDAAKTDNDIENV